MYTEFTLSPPKTNRNPASNTNPTGGINVIFFFNFPNSVLPLSTLSVNVAALGSRSNGLISRGAHGTFSTKKCGTRWKNSLR